jgi:hypothetical protein
MKNILKSILSYSLVMFVLAGCTKDDKPSVVPADAVLVSPLKDQLCEQGVNSNLDKSRIFFEWQRAENAQSYDLVVTDLETGENFITYKDIYDTRKELELVHNHAYSWYVISKNINSSVTGISPTWNFFFVGVPKDNYAPFPASIVSPGYGNIVQSSDGMVTLEWEASDPDGDNLSYTLYLDEIDGMQEPSDDLKNINTTTFTVQLEIGKTYFWKVKSSDGYNSSYSQIYTFSVN